MKSLKAIVSTPTYKGNIRNQLAEALQVLNEELQKILALDYAEHILNRYSNRYDVEGELSKGINTVRQFLAGDIDIDAVALQRKAVYGLHSKLQHVDNDIDTRITAEVSWTVIQAIDMCCQNELYRAGYFVVRPTNLNVVSVAKQAAYAIARLVGGKDWRSEDPARRKAAREAGKRASDEEVRWQIEHLLTTLEQETKHS